MRRKWIPGQPDESYQVLAFSDRGHTTVFSEH